MKRANFLDQIFRKLRYTNLAHFLLNLCYGTGWEPDDRNVMKGSLGCPFFQEIFNYVSNIPRGLGSSALQFN